jgi:hypothetical protein
MVDDNKWFGIIACLDVLVNTTTVVIYDNISKFKIKFTEIRQHFEIDNNGSVLVNLFHHSSFSAGTIVTSNVTIIGELDG